eukprot:33738-Eustigmatos_ZCMA.PRE.1
MSAIDDCSFPTLWLCVEASTRVNFAKDAPIRHCAEYGMRAKPPGDGTPQQSLQVTGCLQDI